MVRVFRGIRDGLGPVHAWLFAAFFFAAALGLTGTLVLGLLQIGAGNSN